jgi:indole-3-glycerol phosphate synthase
VPPGYVLVSESGISEPEHLARLARIGIRTFLIGESLMRQADVESATRALMACEKRLAPSVLRPASGAGFGRG